MKRIIILFAALLLSFSAFAQNGKSIYQKYSDAENVSAVYVSPAMFRMIGQIPDLESGRITSTSRPSSARSRACTFSTARTRPSTAPCAPMPSASSTPAGMSS